jgi:hypothetical protein
LKIKSEHQGTFQEFSELSFSLLVFRGLNFELPRWRSGSNQPKTCAIIQILQNYSTLRFLLRVLKELVRPFELLSYSHLFAYLRKNQKKYF